MRVLITGVNGFVGGHLARDLIESGHTVIGVGRRVPGPSISRWLGEGLDYVSCAGSDMSSVRDVLDAQKPEVIVHLAASRDPAEVYPVNVVGTAQLLDAASFVGTPRIVVVGSSAIYGASKDDPITEESCMRPLTPYGVSKAAADLMAEQVFRATGLAVMRARPFNIVGPGQRGNYVTAVCAQQLAEIEARRVAPIVRLGNLESERDFLDVRDVVRALCAIMTTGEAGEAYNICSGVALGVRALIDQLVASSSQAATIESASSRPSRTDVPRQVGSFAKLAAQTGWAPTIPLSTTLRDVLDDWRTEVNPSDRAR